MRSPLRTRPTPISDGNVWIDVHGGFRPATIAARAGQPLRITFTRHETSQCSERVLFPDFGLDVALPAHEDVVVELPRLEPGEYPFTCGMGMLEGRLVVRP